MELHGKYKAKIDRNLLNNPKDKPNGKPVPVTAITPARANLRFLLIMRSSNQGTCGYFSPVL
ncbi:MAG: formate--tetrahydrofolate ligase [Treponema sp.]|nr:formate--tetrahydrofolate ligase [Treponema sp.]